MNIYCTVVLASRLSKPYTEAKGGMDDNFIRVSVLGK